MIVTSTTTLYPYLTIPPNGSKVRGITQHRLKRALQNTNPHQPRNYTWLVSDFENQILFQISNYTIWPWFPILHFDFAEMGTGANKFTSKSLQSNQWDKQGSCTPSPKEATWWYLYFCPRPTSTEQHSSCGTIVNKYCKSWSCVSTGYIYWTAPQNDDLISITRRSGKPSAPSCDNFHCCGQRINPMNITFTNTGKQLSAAQWAVGYSWGGREWSGEDDDGNIFSIRLSLQSMHSPPVGPNTDIQSAFLQPDQPSNPDPLIALVNASSLLLKATLNNSAQTDTCWLCLSANPPFYEAVGSIEPISNSTNDAMCRWNTTSITITSITGHGCCLGNIPSNYSHYCANATTGKYACQLWLTKERSGTVATAGYNQVFTLNPTGNISPSLQGQFFVPGNNSIWACSTGATACVSGSILINQKAFCIQVRLVPKITYYSPQDFISLMEPPEYHLRAKREVVTAITLSVLMGLGVAGVATGTTALIVHNQQISRLSKEIDEDLSRIETSITALQTSLSSLAEVVLQNRRALDLLFLKEGGMCVALKEECCFYSDKSGIVQDSMHELRKRLKDREQERASQHSWYQSMFNFSPWITTLFSAIAGPCIILLLLCMIGPCVFTRVLQILKDRLNGLDSNISKINVMLASSTWYEEIKVTETTPEKMALLTLSDLESFDTEHDSVTYYTAKGDPRILMNL
ncbi:MLV-related proviral Env polyprotein-like [Protobothrops mucrosquamatus]|uniref:MLV-related proviral Env polyprotein-like n=1 Tax=Protobothrops mucrosquamatus TaxID=103944 RepID=UPI0007758799|nr:MLV-related proviral Env polyprotein-like [Protobothrops mucrosquamatus]